MRDENKHEPTPTPSRHWLDNELDTFDEAKREVQRLQRTLRALIAIGLVTQEKASQAYDIAGW